MYKGYLRVEEEKLGMIFIIYVGSLQLSINLTGSWLLPHMSADDTESVLAEQAQD